jgi:hypothetical protein
LNPSRGDEQGAAEQQCDTGIVTIAVLGLATTHPGCPAPSITGSARSSGLKGRCQVREFPLRGCSDH